MERHSGGGGPPAHLRGRPVSGLEAAHANEYFEPFLNAATLKNILGYHRAMCDLLHLRPNVFPHFYPKLRANLTSWRAKALWKKFDARASHKCYGKGKACAGLRVLVIGAGPCGLRTAIEAQLLGAKVVVVEKRDRLSRNNVLHLWPFVIEDLRMLGAKKFFGKFCAGAIDHISIRQLQCILLKVALLLGVEIHTEVSFEGLIEPSAAEKTGWRGQFKPEQHPVSQYEFDVIIGADGKRNTLQGFKRKEFRGKLAIAITANFINKKTEAEARVEEISGVAFIFNQKFFKELQEKTRIDLENIVYYKDDTHYFVMTAKKASLLEKGVIKQDLADTEKLLALANVDQERLHSYAREAADFSTNYKLPHLEFAVNHYGTPDVAMFDFTSMYAADYASKVVERNGTRLLMILVGDSLLEPFWPTGSGCARGFLSSLDAAWAIRSYCSGQMTPLDVLAERESIYRLLAQTTPDNLNKDWKAYTLDPATRYPNLNKRVVTPHQTVFLYDTDNPEGIDRMKRASLDYMGRPEHVAKKRRRGNVDSEVLLSWLSEQLKTHEEIEISDVKSVFENGRVLCALIHHYRPDLLDYGAIKEWEASRCNQLAMDVLEKELGLSPFMTGEEITRTNDYLVMTAYLTQVYDTFRGEIPHIKHPKLELPENVTKPSEFSIKSIKTHQPPLFPITTGPPSRPSSRHKRHADLIQTKPGSLDRKQRKKRATLERTGPSVEERQKVLEEIACNRQDRQSRRKQQRQRQTEQFLKSMQMLQANCRPDDESSGPFEDYSIFLYRQTAPKFQDRVKDLEKQFTYVPDHESKLPGGPKPLTNTNAEEDIASKIKSLQDKWSNKHPTEKKPKDLMRAIGKIETSDWNIQQIEKKIIENKIGKPSTLNADKERVPRWSKEEFLARQTKMEKKHLDRQDSTEAKYADIDRNIKQLDLKLKEGMNRELGQNKVATITEKLVSKVPQEKEKLVEKPVPAKPVNIQSGSEFCHFCNKRVYLMERLSAEGRFFHHGCFKCQYCHSQLRLGSYMFDRDGQYGYRFFCIHHYGMQGELPRPTKLTRKPSQKGENPRTSPQFPYNSQAVSGREVGQSPQKKPFGVTGVDLLDRVQTPERIEVSNLSSGNVSSDHEDHPSQMDEDEWTDKNFGQSCNELDESDDDDDSTSSVSDTDSDDEAAFDDALEQPVTKEGTMKWAERWKNSYRKGRGSDSDGYSSSDHSSYCENSSDESDSDTATEGEDEIRARELRKQEVRVDPPVVQTDTGTDTEMLSDESSSDTSSEIQNSATEISTDSEFAQDDPTPTRELPHITLNDFHVTKTRGSGTQPPLKCIQITSGYIQETSRPREHLELKLTPRKPLDGYALNRTQSTGGIAAKVSLELKKKYLLGENGPNTIQKSGSASTLDTKFKSFQSTITDCQKLLRPASEVFSKPPQMPPPLPPPPDITITALPEPKGEENDGQGRPRSPVHETSIPVPSIDWSKGRHSQSSDSLGTSSSENESPNFEIPRLEVHEVKEEVVEVEEEQKKSVTSEKKSLNEPKSLPEVDEGGLEEVHRVLHARREEEAVGEAEKSSPDQPLTETELSDWARDENASDSIEIEPQKPTQVPQDRPFNPTPPTINLDSIEFMDTGTSSCEENHRARNDGYVQFKDEEDSEDPPPPLVNEIFEARNAFVAGGFGGHVTDLKPSDLELLKLKQAQTEHEEDSLLVLETTNNTTTEENTCTTDSTVKHVTEMAPSQKIESLQKQRLEDKLAKVKAELYNNEQYEEHCQRLQSKVEFGNAKDSIDVRKSRRRSKQDDAPPQPPDLIQEERHVTLMQLTSPPSTPIRPDVLYNKENIKKERDVNKKLIEDMVMNKMRAENKSLERKRRNRNVGGLSPSRPDLLRPLSVFNAETAPNEAEETPRAPPRYNRPSDVAKTAEKMKENARARARLLSNEDLGLSPEDKLNRLREKLRSQPGEGERGKKNGPPENLSQLEPHTDCKKRSDSFRRSKSTGERPKSVPKLSTVAPKSEEKRENHEDKKKKFCKSDPNLLDTSKKKSERRKSLTKLIAGIFTKGNLLAKLSPKAKTGSKSLTSLDYLRHESVSAPPTKTRSETHLPPRRPRESTPPPPVPPLPANYVPKDESSDGEPPHQGGGGSCDTLDRSGTTTARGGRSGKARKVSRQAQLKRHRMAQEIQRKLEETEVKTRELESRGVEVEKALRGEDNGRCKRDEGELLQEWFDLMRDRTELRRYEKELMVRAQELELEDRHARLQGELRERLENSESFNSIIFVALRSE
ncbi:F-actin-monooxygenase Mical isoform X6 [Anthonomus grandis grandis]|uniref:F-actin-monooxygenase Mical isoform X6 n=1 Tax=Anthonomus grandis grandis TaxID=2921223 RepID=UPI0021664026|nr:F-actin-monooxygenase Mical isoform X6 [Anthonomus grandis grandis]